MLLRKKLCAVVFLIILLSGNAAAWADELVSIDDTVSVIDLTPHGTRISAQKRHLQLEVPGEADGTRAVLELSGKGSGQEFNWTIFTFRNGSAERRALVIAVEKQRIVASGNARRLLFDSQITSVQWLSNSVQHRIQPSAQSDAYWFELRPMQSITLAIEGRAVLRGVQLYDVLYFAEREAELAKQKASLVEKEVASTNRVALVMGNSAYKNTTVLANPVHDARLMEKALQEAGFKVTLVLNADKDTMVRSMLDFGRTLRKGVDASLFYYAGHGVQVEGENYLVPTNASLENEDEVNLQTIPVNAFLKTMDSAKSPVNIVILDACRNNPFSRAFRGTTGGLAPVNAPRGSYIAYATAPGAIAADGEGGNSPYTVALVSVLATPGLKLEDVFKKTREKVLLSTAEKQVPWETSSITGDFYFFEPSSRVPISSSPDIDADFYLARFLNTQASWESFMLQHGVRNDIKIDIARKELSKFVLLSTPAAPSSELQVAIPIPPAPGRIGDENLAAKRNQQGAPHKNFYDRIVGENEILGDVPNELFAIPLDAVVPRRDVEGGWDYPAMSSDQLPYGTNTEIINRIGKSNSDLSLGEMKKLLEIE